MSELVVVPVAPADVAAKSIPEVFRANGYDYRLIKRSAHACVYEQSSAGVVVAWETHIIRLRKGGVARFKQPDGSIKEVVMAAKEALASNEDFGTFAWTFPTLELAMQKFEGINEKQGMSGGGALVGGAS